MSNKLVIAGALVQHSKYCTGLRNGLGPGACNNYEFGLPTVERLGGGGTSVENFGPEAILHTEKNTC